MRSRTTRLTSGAVALIAIGAATFFLAHSERQISSLTSSLRTFDLRARETADAIAELRAAQQAYVAAGQGVAFWMPRVAATTGQIKIEITALRQTANSAHARQALMEAEATVAEFEALDKRAREYMKTGDDLMAGDVIFTEGRNLAATASRQVETARQADRQALDAVEASLRRQQAAALAAAAGVTAVIGLSLVPIPRRRDTPAFRPPQSGRAVAPAISSSMVVPPRSPSPLKMAADLCTECGRIRDVDDLKRVLARTADVMDAKGLVIWLGNTDGVDLQPVVTHGYSRKAASRIPAVPRSADNAAAAAYRTGLQQIVLSRPGQTSGAIVAPILTADGCIGALSAEIRGGTEGSEAVQTLATIIAAQLACVFAATGSDEAPQRKSAQG